MHDEATLAGGQPAPPVRTGQSEGVHDELRRTLTLVGDLLVTARRVAWSETEQQLAAFAQVDIEADDVPLMARAARILSDLGYLVPWKDDLDPVAVLDRHAGRTLHALALLELTDGTPPSTPTEHWRYLGQVAALVDLLRATWPALVQDGAR